MNSAEDKNLASYPIPAALQDAKKRIEPVSESAGLDAQILLAETLGVERAYLLAHPEQLLTTEQAARFAGMVERCAAGEPLAYILGRRAFYDREFTVTSAVLVPRPETEHLLERALEFVKEKLNTLTPGPSPSWRGEKTVTVVDVGTGSGALAVTLAANCPAAVVYATDISRAALAVARGNAQKHRAKVEFFEGDLLTPLIERQLRVDLIMANLPYIASDELAGLAVSKFEPLLALDGGADGLDLVRRLLEQTPQVWNPAGLMLLEIGADQGDAARTLAQQAFPSAQVDILKDYAGLDRIIVVAGK